MACETDAKLVNPPLKKQKLDTDTTGSSIVSLPNYKRSASYVEAEKDFPKGLKRLQNEYKLSLESKDFKLELVDNDLYLWQVQFPFKFSPNTKADGTKMDKLTLRLAFQPSHPFKPPFVRIVSPRFGYGSFVMIGGAICMDTFTFCGWSPAMTAEKSIIAVQSHLLDAEKCVDPVNFAKEYTEEEGKASQAYILSAHTDWNDPDVVKSGSGFAAYMARRKH